MLALDREIGDYVIVHELLHFSVPNHGRLWRSLMRAHLGEYELPEKRLHAATSIHLSVLYAKRVKLNSNISAHHELYDEPK